MWLKAQNEMAGLLPHAAMGPVERRVRHQRGHVGTCWLENDQISGDKVSSETILEVSIFRSFNGNLPSSF